MKRGLRVWIAILALWLAAVPAHAAVTVTFYGHEGLKVRGGFLYFPHAYVRLTGTLDETGEVVDQAYGFTALNPGPQLLFMSGRGVLAEPDARYVAEGIAYLSVEIEDATYHAIQARFAHWRSREGSTYNLNRRNCITFVADIARTAGLTTPSEDTLSPNGFLKELVVLNPQLPAVEALPSPIAA